MKIQGRISLLPASVFLGSSKGKVVLHRLSEPFLGSDTFEMVDLPPAWKRREHVHYVA